MIWNQPSPSITKPCSDCMILGMNAGLEYPDGKDANTDTGMWLHHVSYVTLLFLDFVSFSRNPN
jgi:hypothetical protein